MTLFLAIIFVVLMIFCFVGYGYWGRTPNWAYGPYTGILLLICVAILGFVVFSKLGVFDDNAVRR